MKYEIGPFAEDSPVYRFLELQNVPMEKKIFEKYGLFWSAIIEGEDVTAFILRFPNRQRFFNTSSE